MQLVSPSVTSHAHSHVAYVFVCARLSARPVRVSRTRLYACASFEPSSPREWRLVTTPLTRPFAQMPRCCAMASACASSVPSTGVPPSTA